jgi:DNA-binding transcriptional MerR regulator
MPKATNSREISYLSTGQIAEILGITKKTLKNWLKAQLISEPERNPVNRYRRWTLQDLEAIRRMLSERKQEQR